MTADPQGERHELNVNMLPQPDEVTCGPTCLHALYGYWNDSLDLARVIAEVDTLETGGTLGVFLALHALKRGYQSLIYTYKLQVFDPTWFEPTAPGPSWMAERLRLQARHTQDAKVALASEAYIRYLEMGGRLALADLTPALLRRYLNAHVPIMTGLSSTYLYRTMREFGENDEDDDVRGHPAGHFVVLAGYRPARNGGGREVLVVDPMRPNPLSGEKPAYWVGIDRLINAILLGIVTYDANLVILTPKRRLKRGERDLWSPDHADRRG